MKKITFPKEPGDFFKELKSGVSRQIKMKNLHLSAKRELWLKLIFYSVCFSGLYILLLTAEWDNKFMLVTNYVLMGLSGILLAFNAAHDAAHETFSRNKTVNAIIFRFTFNLQGVNSYLWKMRHIASHHLFPNVDGCDADIDENPMLRLSPTHKRRNYHRFQHIYATLLYMCYTLHWIFIKDLVYLFKKNLSNLNNIRHPLIEIARFFFWKAVYFMIFLFVPIAFGYNGWHVVAAFIIMHFSVSLFFVWTLIISHLTLETSFPVRNSEGKLPFCFYRHQLATSMDYSPRSPMMNWFLGGFNAHAAHHLFPKLPHTMYRHITYTIQRTAAKFNMPYHSKTFFQALRSHYRYLGKMGCA